MLISILKTKNAVLIELTQPLIFIVPTKICLQLAQNLSMPRHYLLTKSKRPKCSENKDILTKVTLYFINGYIISSTFAFNITYNSSKGSRISYMLICANTITDTV